MSRAPVKRLVFLQTIEIQEMGPPVRKSVPIEVEEMIRGDQAVEAALKAIAKADARSLGIRRKHGKVKEGPSWFELLIDKIKFSLSYCLSRKFRVNYKFNKLLKEIEIQNQLILKDFDTRLKVIK